MRHKQCPCKVVFWMDWRNFSTNESNNQKRHHDWCLSWLIIYMMNLETPKLELLWSIIRKLRPCCRNNNIFRLNVTRQFLFANDFLFEYVFERKERARFLKTSLWRAAVLIALFLRSTPQVRKIAILRKFVNYKILSIWTTLIILIATKLFLVRFTNGRFGKASSNEYRSNRNNTSSWTFTIY